MKNQYTLGFSLKLFGEQAPGETGEPAPLQSGDMVEVAPSQPAARAEEKSPEERFEELINGEFKEQFGKRVSQIVKRRLKQQKQGEEKPADPPKTQEGEGGQDPLFTNALAGSVYQDLSHQAKVLGETYPSFNLQRELQNPVFANLITLPGVDMQTAFELTHKEEILPAVIAAAVKENETRIAKSLSHNGARPGENPTAMGSTALAKRDVSTFSKEQMEDICRRVSRGEKIYL